MVLSLVPFAQPENVFCCGRDMALWTVFGLVRITVLKCRLNPGVEVMLLLLLEVFPHLPVCVPIQARQQVLAVRLAG